MSTQITVTALGALLFMLSNPAMAQLSVPERVAALKVTLAASQAALRQYEWIETTAVSLKGDEKSRKQERCYYGADGKVQKVVVAATPPPEKKRGLRGKIIEKKKGELTDYMRDAVGLVKRYAPPNPAMLQAAKDAGKVSIELLEPGKRARLIFRDFEKPGDRLDVEMDLGNNRPLGLTVATYLENPKDAVILDVRMGQLNDGTTYTANTTLVAKAKKIRVEVENSGYRKAN